MNSYKELWIKTYDELYNDFLAQNLSSDEADRRALLLVDNKTIENLTDKADQLKKIQRGE
jgi:hypothetical protein